MLGPSYRDDGMYSNEEDEYIKSISDFEDDSGFGDDDDLDGDSEEEDEENEEEEDDEEEDE